MQIHNQIEDLRRNLYILLRSFRLLLSPVPHRELILSTPFLKAFITFVSASLLHLSLFCDIF
jgi:hypothetical protein